MHDLKELILLLRQHGLTAPQILGAASPAASKLIALYEGVAGGKFETDEAAAEALYPGTSDRATYRKLKHDLREKLFDMVCRLNTRQPDYSDYQRAYYECHKQWTVVKFLAGQNANTAAIALANRVLRQAEKYDFTLLCMDLASYLRVQYGLRESTDRKFREANTRFEHFRSVYDAECRAEEWYTELVTRYVNTRSARQDLRLLTERYFSELEPALRQYSSGKLQMYGYMVGLMRFTAVGHYWQALEYCDKAIAFFMARPYEARVPLQIFYYQRLLCNIQLGQFREGEESARACMTVLQEGTFNWFKFRELYLLLGLHTGRYEAALRLLEETRRHERFEFLPENVQELWRIYDSYVCFVTSELNRSASGRSRTSFKLARFMNEMPIFSKDKSGLNCAIIVIKWLWLLRERQYGRLLDEVERTEQYCYRYLRGKTTQRTYNFIKMLLQIPLSGFDRALATSRAERFKDKLVALPVQLANQTYELEVVPFEKLWQLAIDALGGDAPHGRQPVLRRPKPKV